MEVFVIEKSLSEKISEFLKELDRAKADFEFAQSELTRCEQLTQDYLHKLELESPQYHECARIGRAISQCRIDRRNAKDTIIRYQPIADFLDTERGKSAVGQFQQLLGALRKAERQTCNREYKPRILTEQEYKGRQLSKEENVCV